MLKKLFRKEEAPKQYVPAVLENLTPTQSRHYEQFRNLLNNFHLGKNVENPRDDIVYIGIDDGYMGSINIGEIKPNGTLQINYPQADAVDKPGFLEILNGALRLRQTLEKAGISYRENISKDEYAQNVRKGSEVKTSAMELALSERKLKISRLEDKIKSSDN